MTLNLGILELVKKYKSKFNYKNFMFLHLLILSINIDIWRNRSGIKKKITKNVSFTFNPHLIPTFRGILSSIYLDKKEYIDQKNYKSA